MNTEHTVGPWHTERIVTSAISIRSDNGFIVGEARADYVMPPNEADANARLIAAAPELAEALRAIVSLVDREDEGGFVYCDDPEITTARAVLAKIEGGVK